jgi:hypothetical protein
MIEQPADYDDSRDDAGEAEDAYEAFMLAQEAERADEEAGEQHERFWLGSDSDFVDGLINGPCLEHPDENDPYWDEFWRLKSASETRDRSRKVA